MGCSAANVRASIGRETTPALLLVCGTGHIDSSSRHATPPASARALNGATGFQSRHPRRDGNPEFPGVRRLRYRQWTSIRRGRESLVGRIRADTELPYSTLLGATFCARTVGLRGLRVAPDIQRLQGETIYGLAVAASAVSTALINMASLNGFCR